MTFGPAPMTLRCPVGSSRRLDLGYRQRFADSPHSRARRHGLRRRRSIEPERGWPWLDLTARSRSGTSSSGASIMPFAPTKAGWPTWPSAPTAIGLPPRARMTRCGSGISPLEPTPGAASPVPSLVISGECGGIFGVAWSADGKRLAAAGKDGTVRVWDLSHSPPRSPLILRGHEGEVLCVAFHPGGSSIASGGADRHVRIWDAETGVERQQFPRGRQSRECHRL